jgi:BrnA antitoxin of type II toxin-antitoxin system
LNNMSEEQSSKVQITIKIDADILEFFKKRASQANAAPYQTQINQELRAIVSGEKKAKVKSKKVKIDTKQLLADKKFIKALAEEVRKVNL